MIKLKKLIIEITNAQVKKINKRLKEKSWPISVHSIKNNQIKLHYVSTNHTEKEEEYYNLLHSIIVNNKKFDDIYYSIV